MAEPTAADRKCIKVIIEETEYWIPPYVQNSLAQALADERARAVEAARYHLCRRRDRPCDCERCYFINEIAAAIERGETP